MDFMKLEFRQRLLTSTLLVGASMVAAPAFAQTANPLPVPSQPDPHGTTQPADTAAVPEIPETIAPLEGTTVPSTSATGEPVRAARDIVVTGTRIPQPNLESASPVTVVTSQEVKLSGTTRTEDLINSLPQVFAAQGSNISNGASGTATVMLRGIGSNRTMVLVNGRRLHAGDTGNPVPDINFIPSAMIKRVDLLTGGASSVYGADAVAGVVNFILDTTYTGFRIDGQASVFNHKNNAADGIIAANESLGFMPPRGWSTNGGAQDITGVMGAAFDDGRGHVTAYAAYRSQDPVLQASRDYSFCALNGLPAYDPRRRPPPEGRGQTWRPDVESLGRNFNCAGSYTGATGTFLQYNPFTGAFQDIFEVQGNAFVTGYTLFNYNPYNYFQRPNERYNLGAFADYEIAPAFKPYMEVMFMDNTTDAVIAPSGNFFSTNSLACDNALLTDAQRQRLCVAGPFGPKTTFTGSINGMADVEQAFVFIGRRNVEGGGRQDNINHQAYRIVGGMRGDIALGMSYDAYYQRGRTNRNSRYENDFSITRLGRAIDVIAVDPETGDQVAPGTPGATLVCRAAFTGIDPNCVPWNIFQAGQVDQAALDYLQTPGFQQGQIDQTIAHIDFTFTGDDYGWRMPWAESGVGLNFGAEYRKERLDLKVDEAFRTGDLAGQGGPTPPVSGEFDVRELFAEVQLPIVQNNFISDFVVRAGYRYSDYNVGANSFSTDTYKIEGELAPIPDIRFRASYNRAVRAPNIVELFFPQTFGLAGSVDPCAGPTPSGTLAQCQLTGVTAAQYGSISANPANQYNALFGGNPILTPEKADTYTAGVILQPRFIPGLALTADYWNIRIKNLIGAPGFAATFTACFEGNQAACDRINRDPLTGDLWRTTGASWVELTNQNFEGLGLFTKGFDFQGNYSRRLGGMGTINAAFVGTYLLDLGTPANSEPGGFAFTTPDPVWRHNARVGLTMPNGLGVSVRWRHFSGVDCDYLTSNGCGITIDPDFVNNANPGPLPPERIPIPGNERLSAQNYFDLVFNARLAQRLNLRLGANNIFDRDPPLAGGQAIPAGFGNGNTYPQVYDALGRFLFAGFTVDF
jgi:iron complex outermembrane recepter protein